MIQKHIFWIPIKTHTIYFPITNMWKSTFYPLQEFVNLFCRLYCRYTFAKEKIRQRQIKKVIQSRIAYEGTEAEIVSNIKEWYITKHCFMFFMRVMFLLHVSLREKKCVHMCSHFFFQYIYSTDTSSSLQQLDYRHIFSYNDA